MSFEDLKARIYLLLEEMTAQPKNLHELQEELHEQISELRALGLPVPDDIAKAEQDLAEAMRPPG